MQKDKSCHYVSNNKYFKSPPRMDDARHFTDYRPNCDVNNLISANNTILNSFEYRQFLTHNAANLIELNRNYACEKNCNADCKKPYNQGTMLDEQSMRVCNNHSCNTDFVNMNGIGTGRKYDTKSGSCNHWESKNANQSNSCADTVALFNYYNQIDTKAQGELFPRSTHPSGGKAFSGGDPQAYNL